MELSYDSAASIKVQQLLSYTTTAPKWSRDSDDVRPSIINPYPSATSGHHNPGDVHHGGRRFY